MESAETNTMADATRLHRTVRVNQAGEYGAVRIYQGQLAILRRSPLAPVVSEMLQQEQAHLAQFNALMTRRRVRPTVLSPLWSLAGYGLGVASALMGEKAALACTVAVEEVIEDHYEQQKQFYLRQGQEPELLAAIVACQHDEVQHKDLAAEMGARSMPGYAIFRGAVQRAARVAIWLSERI